MREEIKTRIEAVRRGEVPEGYKKVIPYIIPQDWRVKKLGAITKRTSRPNKDGIDRPAYSINNRKGFVPQSEQFEDGSYQDLDKTAYKIVRRGEFAYNPARVNVGSIGRLRDEDEVIVSSLYVCVDVDDSIDGEYFDAWTKTRDFFEETVRNTEGSVREYLFYENFANMRMPIPPFAEQQKIAEILSTCDRVIELKQQLLDEKRKQKQWLMRCLLSKAGTINEVKLSDLCTVICDGDWIESKDQSKSGIRLVQTGNVGVGQYLDKDGRARYISEETFDRLHCTEIFEGDVLISRLPDPIGRACRIPKLSTRAITAVDCSILRFKDEQIAEFFLQYATSQDYFNKIAILAGGSTRTRISRKEIEKLTVPVPADKSSMVAISVKLSLADREILLLEQELEAWQQKKKALMQLLLTGLVRVNA